MKKALKLFVCSFLLLGVFGCSNSNDKSNTKSDKKDTEVKEETNKADDKNTINTKDDTKTTATLEEKYNQLQKALEKEGMSYILEVKRHSPSKGQIVSTFDFIFIFITIFSTTYKFFSKN